LLCCESDVHKVLLLKNVKVGDFNGRTLSVTAQTTFKLNPDIPQAHSLASWFKDTFRKINFRNISNTQSKKPYNDYPKVTITNINNMDTKGNFVIIGITFLHEYEIYWYKSCSKKGCKTKVIEQANGSFRCEKCDKFGADFMWRIIINVISICVIFRNIIKS
jgi:replication factor A1